MNRRNTSGIKGVSWDKKRKKWIAQLSINNKTKVIGAFISKLDAGRAYNEAVLAIRGEFAWINKL